MLKSIFLLSSISLISFVAQANTSDSCSREALRALGFSDRSYQYTEYFIQKMDKKAIAEIQQAKNPDDFKQKHAEELAHFNDENYHPSQALCDDMYAEMAKMDKKIEEIAKKYHYKP